ncbi:MAG TPA: hypothetical protein VHU19_12090 [Pyrinomonadaceae bacterium]|jgi:hypothetical protein|nr:hypothetical protein [Pyrinomonadaceae bacterium]
MIKEKLPKVFAAHAPCAVLLAATLASAAHAQTPAAQSHTRTAPQTTTSQPSTSQTRQRTGQSAEQQPQPGGADAQADLSITARVTARELRFERVPNPKVEFTGRPRRETVWQSERENLPEQVQPGVTYRNVGITLRITSVFAEIDRIVAEALGEAPASDDSQPQQTTPPAQPSTPPARQESNSPPTQQASPASQASVQPAGSSAPSPSKSHTNVRTTTRRGHPRAGRDM